MIVPVTENGLSFYNNSTKKLIEFHGKTNFTDTKDFCEWCSQNGMSTEDIWIFTRLLEV